MYLNLESFSPLCSWKEQSFSWNAFTSILVLIKFFYLVVCVRQMQWSMVIHCKHFKNPALIQLYMYTFFLLRYLLSVPLIESSWRGNWLYKWLLLSAPNYLDTIIQRIPDNYAFLLLLGSFEDNIITRLKVQLMMKYRSSFQYLVVSKTTSQTRILIDNQNQLNSKGHFTLYHMSVFVDTLDILIGNDWQ